jgi:hypothetical protein
MADVAASFARIPATNFESERITMGEARRRAGELVRVGRWPLIEELIALCQEKDLLGANRNKLQDIGRRLDAFGGLEAMQTAYDAVRSAMNSGEIEVVWSTHHYDDGLVGRGEPDICGAEIECAWDRIGDWLW